MTQTIEYVIKVDEPLALRTFSRYFGTRGMLIPEIESAHRFRTREEAEQYIPTVRELMSPDNPVYGPSTFSVEPVAGR